MDARRGVGVVCAALMAAATLAGCSSGGSSGGGAGVPGAGPSFSGPTGDPVAARHDPCRLFTTAQIDATLGLNFADGKAEHGALEPTCVWYPKDGTGPSAVAAVKKSSQRSFDSDLRGPVADNYHRTSPRLGDDSVWFGTADDQKSSASLIVLQDGYSYQVSIAIPTGTDPATMRTKLLALAQSEF